MTEIDYIEAADLRAAVATFGTYLSDEIDRAVTAASRGVEAICDRFFYPTTLSNDEERLYTATRPTVLEVDDIIALTSCEIDRDGDGVFEEELTEGTDFVLEPLLAPNRSRPYERLVMKRTGWKVWPRDVRGGVKLTGAFGWSDIPAEVVSATVRLGVRLVAANKAPLGIIALEGDLVSAAARIGRNDPIVMGLLQDLIRDPVIA